MKWYYPLECDNTVSNPLVCDYTNFEDYNYDELDFLKGNKITDWNNNILFQAKKNENDGDPDDALQNAELLPIYSERLINALKDSKIEGIQYLPVNILRPDGRRIDGFCLANFLNFIEALDLDKSDYSRFSDDFPNPNARGKISGVRKFVLKENKLIGFDIVRLVEYKRSFFVSEKFKEVFEKGRFTGYSFREVKLV